MDTSANLVMGQNPVPPVKMRGAPTPKWYHWFDPQPFAKAELLSAKSAASVHESVRAASAANCLGSHPARETCLGRELWLGQL